MSNSIILNGREYRITSYLGSGQFGTVFIVEDNEDGQFALKEIQLKVEDQQTRNPMSEELRDEFGHLLELKHESILNIFHWVVAPSHRNAESTSLYFVTEQADSNLNEQLCSLSKNITLLDAKWIVQITSGISFLHSRGFRHCNLKPENILITKLRRDVRLSDFAVVNELRALQQRMRGDDEPIGFARLNLVSQLFWAPETLRTCQFTDESDMFSLGAILYGILTRRYTKIDGVRHYGAFVHESGVKKAIGEYLQVDRNGTRALLSQDESDSLLRDVAENIIATLAYDASQRPTAGVLLEQVRRFYERLRHSERKTKLDKLPSGLIVASVIGVLFTVIAVLEKNRKFL